ncbi:MAG TPA: TraR/DksA family transcriptional regulator [Bryobacteraceae bacterium]|nr:TraR/DksA family transcriptional regulator [Bryobacteraceae bacterium]
MEKKSKLKPGAPAGAYLEMLLEKRQTVLSSLGTNADALLAGDRVSDEDQAQHSLAEAVSLRLNRFEYLQLRQIQEALERLELDEFGVCLSCREPIAPKRLRALPWAKFCVKCQERIADSPPAEYPP